MDALAPPPKRPCYAPVAGYAIATDRDEAAAYSALSPASSSPDSDLCAVPSPGNLAADEQSAIEQLLTLTNVHGQPPKAVAASPVTSASDEHDTCSEDDSTADDDTLPFFTLLSASTTTSARQTASSPKGGNKETRRCAMTHCTTNGIQRRGVPYCGTCRKFVEEAVRWYTKRHARHPASHVQHFEAEVRSVRHMCTLRALKEPCACKSCKSLARFEELMVCCRTSLNVFLRDRSAATQLQEEREHEQLIRSAIAASASASASASPVIAPVRTPAAPRPTAAASFPSSSSSSSSPPSSFLLLSSGHGQERKTVARAAAPAPLQPLVPLVPPPLMALSLPLACTLQSMALLPPALQQCSPEQRMLFFAECARVLSGLYAPFAAPPLATSL